jgi:hypothetical protein
MRAEQVISGITRMAARRSPGSRMMRVAPMAGIAHAWPVRSGTKDLPPSPNRRSSRSTRNTPRAR